MDLNFGEVVGLGLEFGAKCSDRSLMYTCIVCVERLVSLPLWSNDVITQDKLSKYLLCSITDKKTDKYYWRHRKKSSIFRIPREPKIESAQRRTSY